MLLDGRRAFITGAAGRIGRTIVATLQREGAQVAACDADATGIARLAASEPLVPAFVVDVADERALEHAVNDAEAAIGPLDALVTCAAVYPNVPVLQMDAARWDDVFAVNVRGVMLAARTLARRWIERGTPGSIVNLSSAAARSARRGAAAYCASKAALNMLDEVLAIELGPYGIRVNTLAPGLVTDSVLRRDDETLHPYFTAMLDATPLGRSGAPDDIAEAVAFLLSERSAFTTGALLDVTGGSHNGRTHVPFTHDIDRR